MMTKYLCIYGLVGLVGLVACHHESSIWPSEVVSGTIDGPGAFTIKIPVGYSLDPTTASGPLRRWTRSAKDPVIELDSTPTAESEILGTMIDRLPLGDSEGRKSEFGALSRAQTQVRRFGGGDDQLNCFVNYPGREDRDGPRVRAGMDICDSMVFKPRSLTKDADVLHPGVDARIRLDFPSHAFAQVDLKLPKRFIEHPDDRGTGKYFTHGMHVGDLPLISLEGGSKANTCDDIPARRVGPARDGITLCDDEMDLWVMAATPTADEVAQCRIHLPKHDVREKGEPSKAPLLPDAVMEQRQKDAIEICKSMKVTGYQKLGNPTK